LPLHLTLPLIASLLFAIGLIFVKLASQRGVGPWLVTLVTNVWAALLFGSMWRPADTVQAWPSYWQPGVVALLYLVGQVCTFLAVHRGDVSVAAPILGTKILMVAGFLTWIADEILSTPIWLAAVVATLGVIMIQRSGSTHRHVHTTFSVICALGASASFALFDVLIQRWSPIWGAGQFLPVVFGIAALITLSTLPWIDRRPLGNWSARWPLLLGAFFIAVQSLFIVLALALFGDAARVNVVYSLRGIWGVLFAWQFARWLGTGEATTSPRTMCTRLLGAVLLTGAVVVAIAARAP
jgi:drug/metabolite transporter (DMT)-like permease